MRSEGEASSEGFSFREVRGKKVLILGDVGVGKTALTAKLLDEAVSLRLSRSIAVLDLAPTVSIGSLGIGGSMRGFSVSLGSVRYIRPAVIRAPRLEGKSGKEVLELAEINAQVIDRPLTELIGEPSSILFINDLTLYLHAGEPRRIQELLDGVETGIVNAYMGERLREDRGSGISEREEKALKIIEGMMNRIIRLPLKRGWKHNVYTEPRGNQP